MKKFLLTYLLCTLYLVATAEVFNGSCGENLKFTFDSSTGVLTIVGSGPMKDWKTYDAAPWYIENTHVKVINLPEGLTSIGSYAFCGQPIKSVKLPSSIRSIGGHAFENCNKLVSINIPQGCLYINDYAFDYCKVLRSLKIPNNVEYIGERAFYSCDSLKIFNLPTNLKRLGKRAFAGVSISMNEIVIPESLAAILEGTFSGRRLKKIHIPSSIRKIEDNAFYAERVCITDIEAWCDIEFDMGHNPPLQYGYLVVNGTIIKELEIPEGVTRISKCAFYRYSKLTSVTIPKTVEYIGDNAFYECSALTDVYNHAEKIVPIKKGTFYTFRPQSVIDFYVDADKVEAYKQMQEKWYEFEKYTQRKLKIHPFHTSEAELNNPYIDEIINYENADEKPQYVGGSPAFVQYWKTNLRCPLSADEIGEYYAYDDAIYTKVSCEFIVNTDGTISDVRALYCEIKSKYMSAAASDIVKKRFNDEAVRFIKAMPKWTPGMYRGYPVRVKCQMPIEFKYNINFN